MDGPTKQGGSDRGPLDPERLHLPEGMHFSCHHSGRCCEDFWEIPLDERSLDRLKSLPLDSISPEFVGPETYTEPSRGRPGKLALRRVDGRCVFLDPTRRCLIHKSFGAEAKPQTCRDFPFRYTITPRGVFLGLSMACPSVRANRGRPISAQRQWIAQNFATALSVRTIGEPVRLTASLLINFEAYEHIESCLRELLAIETLSLDDRLIGGNVFLQLLERALMELCRDEAVAPEGHDVSARAVELVGVFRRDAFRRVAAIARKARGSHRLHRAIVGLTLTYRSAFDARPRGRIAQTAHLLYQYARHMGGLGSLAMPPLKGRLPVSAFRAVGADWSDRYFLKQVERFCEHSIFRKDLIAATPVLKGYAFMLLNVALIRWYGLAYAAWRGAHRLERCDLDEAIGAVEKYYCLHSDFMMLFERYAFLSTLMDRVAAKPIFAPSLVRPKGP